MVAERPIAGASVGYDLRLTDVAIKLAYLNRSLRQVVVQKPVGSQNGTCSRYSRNTPRSTQFISGRVEIARLLRHTRG